MKTKLLILLCMILLLPFTAFTAQAQESDDEQPLVGFWDECPTPESLPESVTIGALFALTGSASVYGVAQRDGVQLAVDEVNNSGYLGATELNVIFEDSAGDREQAIPAMTGLVTEDNVLAVIGPTLSAEAVAAVPVAAENTTPVLGVSNTATGLEEALGEWYTRNSLPEAVVIPGTIAQATELLGLTAVGVLYGNDDDFTVSGYNVFVGALEENAVEILGTETFARGDVDFNAQLTNLIGLEPDALVVSALAAEATQIILQARALGYTGSIIGGNGFNSPAVLSQAGADAEGLIVGGAWNYFNPHPSESSVRFVEMFEETYGYSPDQFAAQSYTGAWLVATALRCGTFGDFSDLTAERTALRDALIVIADFNSPLGVFSFDPETRIPQHEPIAQIVVEGRFVALSAVEMTDEGPVLMPEATEEP
jgi:branched-chain amino acid transport system substrate-binding protein